MITPLKKLQSMMYMASTAIQRLHDGDFRGARMNACAIESTASRWGPETVKNAATVAWKILSTPPYLGADIVFRAIIRSLVSYLRQYYPAFSKDPDFGNNTGPD